jgi:sugar/nucleoside kinase (ribokinase family)
MKCSQPRWNLSAILALSHYAEWEQAMSEIRPRGPIVVAGHACLDLIPSFSDGTTLPSPGQLAEVGPAVVSTGGAVPNTGLALHKLGFPVRLVALAGDDLFGRALSELLTASGAEVRLQIRPDVSTSYSIVLSPSGSDRSFLHSPGANHEFTPDDVTDADLDGASALHFGYPQAMRRTFEDGGVALANLFARASARGLLTSLDTCFPDAAGPAGRADWTAFFRTILPQVSMFCPSIDELPILIGRSDRADIHSIAADFLQMGAAVVAIKLGTEGLYLRTTKDPERLQRAHLPVTWAARELRSPCFVANAVSATGAGDCTIAGLLAASLCGYGPVDAMIYATAVGAFSVEAKDATGGIRTWKEVLARVAAGWPRRDCQPLRPGYRSLADGVFAGPDDVSTGATR